MRLLRFLLLLTFASFSKSAISQKKIEHQDLFWVRYQLKLNLNSNWQVSQGFEERIYWFPWRQHQFLSQTTGFYKLNKSFTTGLGFTYLEQANPQNPNVKDYENRTELRPHLEITYRQNLNEKFDLSQRLQSEVRVFEQESGKFKYENIRARFRAELSYVPIEKLKLKASDEVMFNIGNKITNNVFDQNRLSLGIQYFPIQSFGIELSYINWFQQRASGNEYYNRDIVRVTFLHTFNLKRK